MIPLHSWLVDHPTPTADLVHYLKNPAGLSSYIAVKNLLEACCSDVAVKGNLRFAMCNMVDEFALPEEILLAAISPIHTVERCVLLRVTDKQRKTLKQASVVLRLNTQGLIDLVNSFGVSRINFDSV